MEFRAVVARGREGSGGDGATLVGTEGDVAATRAAVDRALSSFPWPFRTREGAERLAARLFGLRPGVSGGFVLQHLRAAEANARVRERVLEAMTATDAPWELAPSPCIARVDIGREDVPGGARLHTADRAVTLSSGLLSVFERLPARADGATFAAAAMAAMTREEAPSEALAARMVEALAARGLLRGESAAALELGSTWDPRPQLYARAPEPAALLDATWVDDAAAAAHAMAAGSPFAPVLRLVVPVPSTPRQVAALDAALLRLQASSLDEVSCVLELPPGGEARAFDALGGRRPGAFVVAQARTLEAASVPLTLAVWIDDHARRQALEEAVRVGRALRADLALVISDPSAVERPWWASVPAPGARVVLAASCGPSARWGELLDGRDLGLVDGAALRVANAVARAACRARVTHTWSQGAERLAGCPACGAEEGGALGTRATGSLRGLWRRAGCL